MSTDPTSTTSINPGHPSHLIHGGIAHLRTRLKSRLAAREVFDIRIVNKVLGWIFLCASFVSPDIYNRLSMRTRSLRRFSQTGPGLTLTRLSIKHSLVKGRSSLWREKKIGWSHYLGDFVDTSHPQPLKTSLLIKQPGDNGEKGVLYASFEYNWLKLLAHKQAREFFRKYTLVGASSWSPGDYALCANMIGMSDSPIYIGVSNISDNCQYQIFSPAIVPLPIMACDWCDPDFFHPLPPGDRDIDIVVVSHFGRFKRHWLLFEALRGLPKSLNVVLIGRELPGRPKTAIESEARAFGVRQDLTILTALEIEEVMKYQCRAKISGVFSKREGSCVAVTESMFSNTPVILMNDSHIGARKHINPKTGGLSDRGTLAHNISGMLEKYDSYAPRRWASDHISAHTSSARLNAILRDAAHNSGRPWTQDVAPLCWRYVPRYLHERDALRLQSGITQLQYENGISLENFLSEEQARRRNQKCGHSPATDR